MAINQDLLVKISVDSNGAVKGLDLVDKSLKNVSDAADKTEKETKETSKSFGDLGNTVIVANQALELAKKAFTALSDVVKKTTNIFITQEEAEQKVIKALQLTNQFTEEAKQGFFDFASQLQSVSTIGDETTLSLIATSVALGNSAEQTKNLITASAEVAATFDNINFESAFDQLNKTLSGSAGRLGRLIPEIQNLTKEQLASGAAIDIINEKLGGFSQSLSQTFGGRLQQASNDFGDALETIGRTIVEVFDVPSLLVSFANSIKFANTALDNLRQALQQVDFKTFFEEARVVAGVLVTVLATSLIPTLGILAVSYQPIIIANTILAAKIALVSAGVLGIAAATDIVVKNLKNFMVALDVLEFAFRRVFAGFLALLKNVAVAVIRTLDGLIVPFKLLPGEIGKAFSSLGPMLQKQLGVVDTIVDDQLNKSEQAALNFANGLDDIDTGFFGNAIKQGEKLINTLVKGGPKAKSSLDGVKGTANSAASALAALGTAGKEAFDAIQKLNDTRLELLRSEGKEVEAAKLAGKLRLEAFDEALKKSKDLTAEQQKAAAQARKNIEAINAINVQEAGVREATSNNQDPKVTTLFSSDDIGMIQSQLGEGIASGAAALSSALSPIMAGINAASAVVSGLQAIVDFIPNFINAVADLIGSITDSPLVILEAITNLFSEIPRFITELIPNILTQFLGVIEAAIVFLIEGIPNAIGELLNKIPELVTRLADRLPELVKRFVTGIITSAPKIITALVRYIIQDAPKIAIALTRVLAIELPKAIIEGVVDGVKEAFGLLGDVFNPAQIGEEFEKVGDQVSRASSQLFQVIDDEATSRGLETADRIRDAIGQGTERFRNIFQGIINALVNAWRAIFDWFANILGPILVRVWRFLFELFENLGAIVAKAWKFLLDFFQNTLGPIIKNIWDFVISFFKNFGKLISDAWKGILRFFTDIYGPLVSKSWKFIIDTLKNLGATVSKAFKPLTNFLAQIGGAIAKAAKPLTSFIGNIGGKLSDGVKKAFGLVGDLLVKGFREYTKPLSQLFSSAGSFFKKIFPPIPPSQGTVEKALGIDIPVLKFAEGGAVPGQGTVAGDSVLNDRILALLSPGEFILSRSQVKGLMNQGVNFDEFPKFAVGGFVGQVLSGDVSVDLSPEGIANAARDGIKGLADIAAQLDPSKLFNTDILATMRKKTFEAIRSILKLNEGGLVPGNGFSDTVPAMLTPGEFVLNRGAVARIGANNLGMMNAGGGMGDTINNFNIELEFNLNNNGQVDANVVRQRIIPSIRDELKKASLRGEFVISQRGVQ